MVGSCSLLYISSYRKTIIDGRIFYRTFYVIAQSHFKSMIRCYPDCIHYFSTLLQDLVAWISMGSQHIPHTEDLPVTHTPGMDLSVFLLPYNYFPEDPSMASRDSIRIEPKKNPAAGVRYTRYNKPNDLTCLPPANRYQELLQKNPRLLFGTE